MTTEELREKVEFRRISRVFWTFSFFMFFVCFYHFNSKISVENPQPPNILEIISLFLQGVFLGLAVYGLMCLIRQYKRAQDWRGFVEEVKKTITLSEEPNEPDYYDISRSD